MVFRTASHSSFFATQYAFAYDNSEKPRDGGSFMLLILGAFCLNIRTSGKKLILL